SGRWETAGRSATTATAPRTTFGSATTEGSLRECFAQDARVDHDRELRARARRAIAFLCDERLFLDHDVEKVGDERAGVALVVPHPLDERRVEARALDDERPHDLGPRANALARADHGAYEADDLAPLRGIRELRGRRMQAEQLAIDTAILELDRVAADRGRGVLDLGLPDRHGVDFALRERLRHVGKRR